jgi:hypothetical protein
VITLTSTERLPTGTTMAASVLYMPPNLPKFSGMCSENFDLFIKKFVRTCKGFGLDDDRILALLPLHLEEKALADYNDLETEGELGGLDLLGTINKLRGKSGHTTMWNRGHNMLTTQKMKPGQTVSSYYAQIRERAERAGLFMDVRDKERSNDIVWVKFNEGLTNHSLKKHLLQKQPKSLEETIRLAMEWESVQLALDEDYGSKEKVKAVVSAITSSNQDLEATLKALSNLNTKQQEAAANNHRRMRADGRPREQRHCYNCDKVGHLARDCWSKRDIGTRVATDHS